MSSKPRIGITKPDNEDFLAFLFFQGAVKIAGGKPVILTASDTTYKNTNIDGLLLGGGKDIFPGLYNQPHKEEYQYDESRDEMEVFWAERSKNEDIPVLGICRGAQLLNIVCGGDLHPDVSTAYENANYPDGFIHNALYRKEIEILPDTKLYEITGRTSLMVNSIHKQAIATLGNDLKINARENNGVIQAISNPDHPFFLGVQFHPEFLIYKKTFRKIFRALVKAASARTTEI